MIRLRMMPIRAYAAGLLLLCSSFPAWAQSADEAEALFREGYELLSAGGYAQALEPLGRAKAIYEKLPPSGDISAYMALYLGICHYQLAEYDKALAELREAVTRSDARGFQDVALSSVLYMGNVLFARNEYGLARDLYNDAFERAGEAGMTGYYASIYKGLADVYIAWGKYEDAAVSYRAALAEALSAGDANTELFIRDGLARALFSMGSLDEALEEAEKAHSIALASDSPYLYTVLDTLGIIHMYAGRNLDAENAFLKALNLAAAAGNAAEEARLYVHLGGVRHIRKDWDGAVQAYEQALSLFADLDRPDDESVCLTNLGGTAYAREDFAAAADYFSRSLELKENLRLTAEGFDRVRYQTAQYHVYQYLVLANARQEKWAEAFGIMETVNGRYLRERLGEKVPVLSGGGTGRAFPAFLGDDTAVMAFAGTSLEDYAVIVVTSKGYSGFTAPVSGVASGLSVHAGSFTSFEPLAAVRGLVVTAAAPAAAEGPAFSFYDAVRLYWTSLSVPAGNPAEAEARAAMSREFYGHFIGPVRNSIDGKKSLLLYPTGTCLSFRLKPSQAAAVHILSRISRFPIFPT
ncbi:MAG: tetratricopeptide repeat protein [Spirochaetales bacterium]|nr:MAG: tetratricopeptide repeat protein [Spirochaetales bacterium]